MNNSAAIVATVLVQTLAGLGVLAVVGLASTLRDLLRNAAVAPLAGMAWTGIVGATLATFGLRLSIAGLVILTIGTCLGGARRMRRHAGDSRRSERTRSTRSWLDRAAAAAALLALGAVAVSAARMFHVKPLAEYDGWAMWGMKSRAIASLGAADPDVFASSAYSRLHLEYPLLLPSLHALPLQLVDGFPSNVVVLSCFAVGAADWPRSGGFCADGSALASSSRSSPRWRPHPRSSASSPPATQTSRSRPSSQQASSRRDGGCSTATARGSPSRRCSSRARR